MYHVTWWRLLQATVTELFLFDQLHPGRLAPFNPRSSKKPSLVTSFPSHFANILRVKCFCMCVLFKFIKNKSWKLHVLPVLMASVSIQRLLSICQFYAQSQYAQLLFWNVRPNLQHILLPYCKYVPPESLSSHSDTLNKFSPRIDLNVDFIFICH